MWQAYVPRGDSLRLSQDAGITMVTCTKVARCQFPLLLPASWEPSCQDVGLEPHCHALCRGGPSTVETVTERENLRGCPLAHVTHMYCSFHKLSPVTQEQPEELR